MNGLKAILYDEMNAMSVQMDCRHKLAAIRILSQLAIEDLSKSLDYERTVNKSIEGQLRLWKSYRALNK